MKYKSYQIKTDLVNKKIRFFNDLDDCVVSIKNLLNKTIPEIELFIMDEIDKRIKHLTY
tara:strand:+ start:1407 stop:1583 length:177 start_codon:yes stop_codon:yes gene_type:complete